ncbi:uncharacterized protein Triagg1_10877 [Trichoderma aggressivum f. europaeum]|uniref:Uncharacterized protein n=1 Tax=Trichoderma aggressivum f. europaeum TaxID=173218 RepID=A0AAE1I535_9HYPO|nr:hypothetical protein Triagg1_10877 [Trichoderma aggressivum f. europaeum]
MPQQQQQQQQPRHIYAVKLLVGPEHHPWPASYTSRDAEWAESCRISPINVRQSWSKTTRLTGDLTLRLSPESLAEQFPGLKPTGAYEFVEKYFGRSWHQHVWEVRDLLLRMRGSMLANNFGLQAMLAVLCQGNTKATAMQEFIKVLNTTPWRNGTGNFSDPRLDEGDELVDADLPGCTETDRIRNELYTHRWVLTFFNFGDAHWVAAVFDSLRCTLTLYDTIESNREKRAKAAGLAWRSFALNMGMPCGTLVVSPALPEQPNDWACGYIGLVNLLLATRCRQGDQHRELSPHDFPRTWLHADARPASYAKMPNSGAPFFPVPDWTYGAGSSKEAWRRASTVLHAMMANELGIRSLGDLERYDAGRRNNQQANEPYEFSFHLPFPGEPIALLIHRAGDWKTKPTTYPKGAPVLSGFTRPPTVTTPAPSLWAPFRDYVYRNLPGEAGSVAALARRGIRCWNPSSSRFFEQNLPRASQTAQAAISVSSGTRPNSRPYDVISLSSGGPGE